LQTETLRVVVDPMRGCKITSLVRLPSDREWLLQSDRPAVESLQHGSIFTDSPMCGWDEMFPTVDACTYLRVSLAGTSLPDHGEVWSRAWEIEELTPTSIRCSIRVLSLPYHFQRELKLDGSAMSLQYRLATDGPESLVVLWAPHPQFTVNPGTLLSLPADTGTLDTKLEGASRMTRFLAVPAAGFDCTQVVPKGAGMMLYAPPDVLVDSARLCDPDGSWLQMSWDAEQVLCFAVWMDNSLYAPTPIVCPEPMSGYYDSLRRAYESGRVLEVEAAEPAVWTLNVSVGRI
jgi:galactose mutarotase-like enzyme